MAVDPIPLQEDLEGAQHPAGRDALVALAEGDGADEEVLSALRAVPDREHDGPDAVSSGLSVSGRT